MRDQEIESGSLSSLTTLATLYLDRNRVRFRMVMMTIVNMKVMATIVMMVAQRQTHIPSSDLGLHESGQLI